MGKKKGIFLLAAVALLTTAGHRDRNPDLSGLLRAAVRLHEAADRFSYLISSHSAGYRLSDEAQRLGRAAAELERSLRESSRHHVEESLRRVDDRYYALRHRMHFGFSIPDHHDSWYSALVVGWLEVVQSYEQIRRIPRPGRAPGFNDPRDRGTTTIRCQSEDYLLAECPMPGRILDLRLVRKRSQAACIPGKTYGYERDVVWVSEGCDAEFRVRFGR